MEIQPWYDWFHKYVQSFYSPDEDIHQHILLKEEHTLAVVERCGELARHLGLAEADCRLAQLIGLFHDIGRFKQYTVYRTFRDSQSENHALLGLREIEGMELLNQLSDEQRQCFRFAIAAHNAVAIPADAISRQLLFSRIIRDADKLDIYRVLAPLLTPPGGQGYSRMCMQAVLDGKQCDYNNVKTIDDYKLVRLSWIYDLNFSWTLRQIAAQGYIGTLIRHLPDTPEMRLAAERLHQYVQVKTALPDR